MAWDKDIIFLSLVTPTTGADDTASHTVEFQPIDQAYPTGHTDGTQCSTETSRWYPASDLDENTTYDIYVDAVRIGRIQALNAVAPVGG